MTTQLFKLKQDHIEDFLNYIYNETLEGTSVYNIIKNFSIETGEIILSQNQLSIIIDILSKNQKLDILQNIIKQDRKNMVQPLNIFQL